MDLESVPPVADMMHGIEGMPVEPVDLARQSRACMTCGTITPSTHYLVNGQRTCETCASQVPADESTRLGRSARALVFGSVAATLCAALWYAVMTITGYELGLIALIVGLVVGVAVRLGSKGRGGWVYQGMAVTLTYLAIVSTYVPIMAEALAEGMAEATAVLYAVAVPLALISPILMVMDDFAASLMWLIIIGIALYEAWKVNQGNGARRVEGPFEPS